MTIFIEFPIGVHNILKLPVLWTYSCCDWKYLCCYIVFSQIMILLGMQFGLVQIGNHLSNCFLMRLYVVFARPQSEFLSHLTSSGSWQRTKPGHFHLHLKTKETSWLGDSMPLRLSSMSPHLFSYELYITPILLCLQICYVQLEPIGAMDGHKSWRVRCWSISRFCC
jgi:hypothetical protein